MNDLHRLDSALEIQYLLDGVELTVLQALPDGDYVKGRRFTSRLKPLAVRFAPRLRGISRGRMRLLIRELSRELLDCCLNYREYQDPALAAICTDLRLQRRLLQALKRPWPDSLPWLHAA